ncbi:MAG: hypothetical protein ACI81L_002284 [Verrucomicrobiales bacterium]|jgi:hypothetical protein
MRKPNWGFLGSRSETRAREIVIVVLSLVALGFSAGPETLELAFGRTVIDPDAIGQSASRQLVTPGEPPSALASTEFTPLDATVVASPIDVANTSFIIQSDESAPASGGTTTPSVVAEAAVTNSLLSATDSSTTTASTSGSSAKPSPAKAATTTAPVVAKASAKSSTTKAPTTTSPPVAEIATTTPPSNASTAATTTTSPPAVAGKVLLDVPIDGMKTVSFGSSRATVESALETQFPNLRYASDSNWDDYAIVSDPNGDYLRTRSNIGDNSRKQWNVSIPVSNEQYLVYRFYLEPGFDAGDGNGSEGRPVWGTGIKMPGLMRGTPGASTGGSHSPEAFSGRLMIRGTRKSDGSNSEQREGLSLGAYIYGQKIDGKSIASGYGEDYYFLNGFGSKPFSGLNNGTHEGVGDPRIWDLEVGKWTTVVLGHRVDGDNGWFKAWTMTDGGSLQPRLHIPRVNWMGSGENQGADSLIFQQYWGGSGSVWHPDSVSYMRFKDFGVYTSQADAMAAAR